jgi:hypothetical protein
MSYVQILVLLLPASKHHIVVLYI